MTITQLEDRLLTAGQVAKHLQVSKLTVYRWIRQRQLPAVVLPNGGYRIEPAELRRFMAHTPSIGLQQALFD